MTTRRGENKRSARRSQWVYYKSVLWAPSHVLTAWWFRCLSQVRLMREAHPVVNQSRASSHVSVHPAVWLCKPVKAADDDAITTIGATFNERYRAYCAHYDAPRVKPTTRDWLESHVTANWCQHRHNAVCGPRTISELGEPRERCGEDTHRLYRISCCWAPMHREITK